MATETEQRQPQAQGWTPQQDESRQSDTDFAKGFDVQSDGQSIQGQSDLVSQWSTAYYDQVERTLDLVEQQAQQMLDHAEQQARQTLTEARQTLTQARQSLRSARRVTEIGAIRGERQQIAQEVKAQIVQDLRRAGMAQR